MFEKMQTATLYIWWLVFKSYSSKVYVLLLVLYEVFKSCSLKVYALLLVLYEVFKSLPPRMNAYICGLVLFRCWALLGVIVVFFSLMLSPTLISGNMPVNPMLALFENFEQVSNFVQRHLSNFIGPHLQSSGLLGSGFVLSISSSSKAPLAKTTSSVQLGDTAVKVSISYMLIFIVTLLWVCVVL